ncbi:radical SAM protein [Streptomyces sp. NPDC001502]|uniref:radical SAM protein n=1 Tax=Streptomyces sp. NPDC001502 TaxID=3364578 RepID=UPI00368ECD30
MIGEVTGIRRIRMLDLQLLYRCTFECQDCLHGARLQHAEAFTAEQAANLLTLMREEYGTEAVVLLGGEPFVHKDLMRVVRHAKQELGLQVEICTNGHRIERPLTEIARYVDLLRISLEGTGSANGRIRKVGSFRSALRALGFARELGVRTAATLTVTSRNIDEVPSLARAVQDLGGRELRLHCLQPLGHAANHPDLLIAHSAAYARLRDQLQEARLAIEVIVDEDRSEDGTPETRTPAGAPVEIERIEADPRGALTMSCTAVGQESHAFWYDKLADRIVHRPTATGEFPRTVPDMVFSRA